MNCLKPPCELTPSGLNDHFGATVLAASMKLREAQNIPDRMLIRFFQASSTLKYTLLSHSIIKIWLVHVLFIKSD